MEHNDAPEREAIITDNDLNAIEAWGLGSSQVISEGVVDMHAALVDLFHKDRRRALTPRNVLLGAYSIEDENRKRQSQPYADGINVLFGPKFAFAYQHKTYLGPLNEDGISSGIEIEVMQGGSAIDLSSEKLDPQFEEFYQAPVFVNNRAILKYRDDV